MAERILVVEDDHHLRRLYRTALIQYGGYEVREAADGASALVLLEAEPPDLVVLDLLLPRVSGPLVHQEIAAMAHIRKVPVVIVTGSTEPLDHPCVLRKPVSAETLVATVKDCLIASQGELLS
jgi:DNA-binding response OmpR family regulator